MHQLFARPLCLIMFAACLWGGVSACTKATNPVEQPERAEDPVNAANVPAPASRGTVESVEIKRPDMDPVVLQDVAIEKQANSDRIIFTFEGSSVPGYRVAYTSPPVEQCGSGEPLTVNGTEMLIVNLSPAQAHTEAGLPTLKQREQHPLMPVLQEMELSCDFEGEVSWALGLAARKPYQASELSDPARLMIEIEH